MRCLSFVLHIPDYQLPTLDPRLTNPVSWLSVFASIHLIVHLRPDEGTHVVHVHRAGYVTREVYQG